MKYLIGFMIIIWFISLSFTSCSKTRTSSTINESFIVAPCDNGTKEEFKIVDDEDVDSEVANQDKPQVTYRIKYISVVL